MSEEISKGSQKITKRETIFYSFAGIADTMSYQMFSFYIFNYYLVLLGEEYLLPITIGFIVWTIWNAINDPLLGAISDRTTSRWGRRKPFIIGGLVPLILLIILLWTPFGSELSMFIYFLIIINIFDTVYTMYSLNQTSLFPEMFQNLEDRAKANNYVQIFNVIGLLLATLIPTLLVGEGLETGETMGYIYGAIIMAIITTIFGFLFVKFGIKERVEFSKDPLNAPTFLESVKFTFNNRPFRTYVLTNLAVWYVFGLFPIISPHFLKFVLVPPITQATLQSVYLALVFIVAILFMIPWSKLFNKMGPRKAELLALGSLILVLVPFMIVWEPIGALIAYILAGIGFAGIMFGRDMMMSTIIDSDELKTGIRREAAYYGVNALIIRLSTIGVYLSIFFVFSGVGLQHIWGEPISAQAPFGIRALIFIFPAIVLILGLLSLLRFPITKEKYDEMQIDLDKLHNDKIQKIDISEYKDIL
ncbi:MAG: MFS transporter [Promethearchaeota archaeon]|nr:MAG: MFS transporter [Candidatus Lokiarchaeota archaeon]